VGGVTQFNRFQPFGSLQYNYHQPLANLSVDLGHNLEAKAIRGSDVQVAASVTRLVASVRQVRPSTGTRTSAVSDPVHGSNLPLALEVHDLSAVECGGNFEENL